MYEEEIKKMEAQRGVDARVINPSPGFVIKTRTAKQNMKHLINICHSAQLQPAFTPSTGAGGMSSSRSGQHWSLPYSLAEGRDGEDRHGKPCRLYDVVFHPETIGHAFVPGDEPGARGGNMRDGENALKGSAKSPSHAQAFRKMLINTALDGIEGRFFANGKTDSFDRDGVVELKNKTFWGTAQTSIIRERAADAKDEVIDPYDPLEMAAKAAYPYGPAQPKGGASTSTGTGSGADVRK